MAESYGVMVEPGTIRFERLLVGPLDRVWTYLTRSDLRRQWLAAGEMELRVGGKVTLVFKNSELSWADESTPDKYKAQEGAVMRAQITTLEINRKLGMTWGEGENVSEVVFELVPQVDKILMVLTHRGLKDQAEELDVLAGWHLHLAMLEDLLSNRPRRAFWSNLAIYEDEYRQRLPAGT